MRLTVHEIQKALEASRGLVAAAAKKLGCTRQALYRRIQNSVKLQELIEQAREEVLDEAEDQLQRAVRRGEHWAVTFLLKTLGRSRGYVERQETVDLTKPPTIRIDVSNIPDEIWESLESRRPEAASAAGAGAEASSTVYLVDQT